jgi:hypothetical protein
MRMLLVTAVLAALLGIATPAHAQTGCTPPTGALFKPG